MLEGRSIRPDGGESARRVESLMGSISSGPGC
jgi:hypothetical protein